MVNPAFANFMGYEPGELIGKAPEDISDPEIKKTLNNALRERQRGQISTYSSILLHKDGRKVNVLITGAPRVKTGEYAGTIAAITDITEIKRAEAEREELIKKLEISEHSLRQSAMRLEIIHEIDRALLSARSLDEIKLHVLASINHLIPCRRASITIFNFEYNEAFFIAASFDGQTREIAQQTYTLQIYGEYIIDELRKNKPYIVPDVLTEPKANDLDKELASAGYRAWLYIPLLYQGQLIGALNLARGEGQPFQQEDVNSASDIANELALAIQQTRLYDALQMELYARNKVEMDLRREEKIWEAVAFAAEQFLKTPDWHTNIDQVLEHLGMATQSTHAYLFENHLGADNVEYSSLKYEWTASGYPSDLDNVHYKNPRPLNVGEDEINQSLSRGEVFIGILSNFPESEREYLRSLNIQTLIELPIFVDGKWWGTMGLDDVQVEREWSNAEIDALKVATEILGAAIQRQKAETAVRESERIYRQAIETAGAVPYYQEYDVDRYIFIGDGIEKITGYMPDEMTATLWSRITLESELKGKLAGFDMKEAVQHVRTGKVEYWACDLRIRTRDGQIKWVADTAIEIFDGSDVSLGSMGILQDITERKLTEANLRKRESLLNAVAFSAEKFLRTPNWRDEIDEVLERLGREVGTTHAYLFENHPGPNGEKLNSMRYEWTAPGYPSDLSSTLFQNSPEYEPKLDSYSDTLKNGEPFIGIASRFPPQEWQHFFGVGIKSALEMSIMVNNEKWGTLGFDDMVVEREWTPMEVDVIKAAANVLGAAIKRQLDEDALKNELAERRHAQQALRFSEKKFSKAFNATQVYMSIEDSENRFVDVNKAFMEGFGFSHEQMIGRTSIELNIVSDPNDIYRLRKEYEENGFLRNFELRVRRANGEVGNILISTEPFSVDDVEYTLTSGLDITSRKHTEAEREALIHELERKNAELEQFTYTVSHDLKSPLVTISGFLGYIEKDAASGNMERLKRDIDRVHEAVNKMQNLLNELLELSRIGRLINTFESTPFNVIAANALQVVHGRLQERQIYVSVQPDMPSVNVDKQRIIEVLQNLIDNAAKFMGSQAYPAIEIGQRGEEGGKLIFFVKDNGIGVAPEYHERIFGLFNRLDPNIEGTGIGLALVKRIVEFHGGRIWVESEIGQGSTFYFTLPRPSA
jgi:PAS domain S-box-containing protein